MARVGRAHRGDARCVGRCGQPIEHGGADLASPDCVIAGPSMAGDQEHDALTGSNRPFQRVVDRFPGLVEVVAVEVQHAVRFDRA